MPGTLTSAPLGRSSAPLGRSSAMPGTLTSAPLGRSSAMPGTLTSDPLGRSSAPLGRSSAMPGTLTSAPPGVSVLTAARLARGGWNTKPTGPPLSLSPPHPSPAQPSKPRGHGGCPGTSPEDGEKSVRKGGRRDGATPATPAPSCDPPQALSSSSEPHAEGHQGGGTLCPAAPPPAPPPHPPVQVSLPPTEGPPSVRALSHSLLLQLKMDTAGGGRGNYTQFLIRPLTGGDREGDADGQTGVVCVRVSGCRTTCRQSRRTRTPMLPAIAEM